MNFTMNTSIECRQWESALDGIDNIKLTSIRIQPPGPGEVLVKIKYVSLNYKDGETVEGQFNHHKSIEKRKTIVPCGDAAGEVFLVGGGVKKWKQGDRVISIAYPDWLTGPCQREYLETSIGGTGQGTLAEYRVFKESAIIATPEYLTDEEACTLPIAGTTAWMAINAMRPLGNPGGSGEVILIQGTGGVSINGLLIAKASGASVIITSSSDEKLARAKALGADHLINYKKTPDWEVEVLRITQNKGVDIIFETGGAGTTAKSFQCVRFSGLINGIGYVSGKIDPPGERLNINVCCIQKNLIYRGMLNGPRDRVEEMLAFYELHRIKPVIGKKFPFSAAKEAFAYMWRGGHFGKVVVCINEKSR